MRWAVGGRFHFSAHELRTMPIRELEDWYEGHAWMHGEDEIDNEALKKAFEAARAAIIAGKG